MKVYKNKKAEMNILSTYDLLIKEWNVPVTQMNIPTQYGTTHVNICGDESGIPLVLFHGVGDDSALMWIHNAKCLSEHFRLYAIDTIGGPGKSKPSLEYNKEFEDVIWIDEILDNLGLDAVNIVGVSHGGYLAQLYSLKRPDRLIKAICMASTLETGNHLKNMIKIFFPEALFPTKHNITKLIKKLLGKNYEVFTENRLIFDHFTYLLKGYNNMGMMYHKVNTFKDDEIDVIRSKCLFLVGESDPFAVLGGKDILEKYNMNVKFFKDVGHGINHEIPDEINYIITSYF